MIRPLSALAGAVLMLLLASPAGAQSPLTLDQALAKSARHADARIAAAAAGEAAERLKQARAGYLPRVDVTESWQHGNQPVFVFGSLLAQRRFTAADFALDALNRPSAMGNFRAALSVDQRLFDPATRAQVRAAELGRDMARAGEAATAQQLVLATTEAYAQVMLAEAAGRTAAAAVEAAEADRTRARDRFDAGLVTEADALAVDVHLGRMREAQIRATADLSVARARLNALMDEPLDTVFVLAPSPVETTTPLDVASLEQQALDARPEVRAARLEESLGATGIDIARAAFLPQVSVQGGWELNGGSFGGRESSWVYGASLRLNVFNGLADRARLAEARLAHGRRRTTRERLEQAVRLEVRSAVAAVSAARARHEVARTLVAQATESQRILRDRYEQGLADMTALLRAAEAVVAANGQQLAAEADLLITLTALARAAGR